MDTKEGERELGAPVVETAEDTIKRVRIRSEWMQKWCESYNLDPADQTNWDLARAVFYNHEHEFRKPDANPLATQVGGSHYKDMAIQPIEYIMKNNLNFCQGNAIKYTSRYKWKNGKQDLEKAIHCLQMLIEMEYPDNV